MSRRPSWHLPQNRLRPRHALMTAPGRNKRRRRLQRLSHQRRRQRLSPRNPLSRMASLPKLTSLRVSPQTRLSKTRLPRMQPLPKRLQLTNLLGQLQPRLQPRSQHPKRLLRLPHLSNPFPHPLQRLPRKPHLAHPLSPPQRLNRHPLSSLRRRLCPPLMIPLLSPTWHLQRKRPRFPTAGPLLRKRSPREGRPRCAIG